ncbi:MAG: 3-keto-disaccharide hydrolase [Bacteroidota bacterium]
MKTNILLFFAIFMFTACGQTHNTLTEEEQSEGWQLMFDGQSTDGWHMYNGPDTVQGWTIEDGNLVALGKGGDIGGDIVSDQKYENFELKWDWKIESQGNSGVMSVRIC